METRSSRRWTTSSRTSNASTVVAYLIIGLGLWKLADLLVALARAIR